MVHFEEDEALGPAIATLNGRFFAGQKIVAEPWDGKQKFKRAETEEVRRGQGAWPCCSRRVTLRLCVCVCVCGMQEKQKRLENWADFLGDDEEEKESTPSEKRQPRGPGLAEEEEDEEEEEINADSDDDSDVCVEAAWAWSGKGGPRTNAHHVVVCVCSDFISFLRNNLCYETPRRLLHFSSLCNSLSHCGLWQPVCVPVGASSPGCPFAAPLLPFAALCVCMRELFSLPVLTREAAGGCLCWCSSLLRTVSRLRTSLDPCAPGRLRHVVQASC
jgi:hypothetical protein